MNGKGGGTGKKKALNIDLNFEDKIDLGNRFQRGSTMKLTGRNKPSGGDSLKNSMIKTPGGASTNDSGKFQMKEKKTSIQEKRIEEEEKDQF
mmetsp:Transcript_100/g.109  ORF Transcript_100/g.109 Transcript_100/m.109 type:complete len:92 (-) Transcript_100:15-290(-)